MLRGRIPAPNRGSLIPVPLFWGRRNNNNNRNGEEEVEDTTFSHVFRAPPPADAGPSGSASASDSGPRPPVAAWPIAPSHEPMPSAPTHEPSSAPLASMSRPLPVPVPEPAYASGSGSASLSTPSQPQRSYGSLSDGRAPTTNTPPSRLFFRDGRNSK